jgi:hypothetical protein
MRVRFPWEISSLGNTDQGVANVDRRRGSRICPGPNQIERDWFLLSDAADKDMDVQRLAHDRFGDEKRSPIGMKDFLHPTRCVEADTDCGCRLLEWHDDWVSPRT